MKTNNEGLRALTTSQERREIRAIRPVIKLQRTYNQKWPDGSITKYWRVIGPATCPSLNSDLSLEGLKEWNLI